MCRIEHLRKILMDKDLDNSIGIVKTQFLEVVGQDKPLKLQCGKSLAPIMVAYETYGSLNQDKSNAILVCHALSGNAHIAGYNSPEDKKPGWWDSMVGPGKGIDTNKYFVICSNFLGGCSGTTGPGDVNPHTGKPYCLEFPIITIEDMVDVQKLLIEKLGIQKLLAVIGGSMGGMQVLQWAIKYPDVVRSAVVIASTSCLSSQSIAFDAVGRNAILGDNNFNQGLYYDSKTPSQGLAIARMIGHITYLSEKGMREKFGRQLRNAQDYQYEFSSEFSIETYLDYQGQSFVDRFDANSYLYITKAMDYFDLEKQFSSLSAAFKNAADRFLVVSFSSDWLFTPEQSEEIVDALIENGKDVSYCNIESHYGHDAFLLETESLGNLISGFVDTTYRVTSNTSDKILSKPSKTNGLKISERAKRARIDYELIESMIEPKSRVLDVGCGDGELLARLSVDKNIIGQGIEIDQNLVIDCVGRGLTVRHRDIERGFNCNPADSFDYVILSQTIQTLKDPARVFQEMLRIGKKVIISFPNFAHYKCRMQLFFGGFAPMTKQMPFSWYNSPNIHFMSLKDFDKFCKTFHADIIAKIPLIKYHKSSVKFLPNLLAEQAVYVVQKSAK